MDSVKTMDILNSVFLMLLAIYGTYIGNNLTCKIQKLMEDNIYLKNIVLVVLVYFTISVSTSTPVHPFMLLWYTLIITVLFIIMNKMTLISTLISYIIFSGIYVISNFIRYYEYKRNNEKTVDTLKKVQEILMIVFISVVIVGFVLYYMEKRVEYKGKNWNMIRFILGGVVKCKSVKDGI